MKQNSMIHGFYFTIGQLWKEVLALLLCLPFDQSSYSSVHLISCLNYFIHHHKISTTNTVFNITLASFEAQGLFNKLQLRNC